MNSKKIAKLQQAIAKLHEAQLIVLETLGDSDSAEISVVTIQEAIDDLRADILDLS